MTTKNKAVNKPSRPLAEHGPLSRMKKSIFYAVVILLPFLVLVIAEISLRAFHYEGNLDSLVIKKSFEGKEYYSINPEVSKRYFASHNVGIPEPYEELFKVNKSPNTFRIFCLGESTMYGYPYPSNATAPRFLRDQLAELFPGRTIEVVNFGIPAVSSAVVLDILKEAVTYQPDLIIIYSGHNEFYGTYGVASTEYLAQNKHFLDFYMQLRKLKLFQLARNSILSAKSLFVSQAPSTRRSTFLERMVQDKYIPLGSQKYIKAREMFEGNLRDMVSVSRNAGVPILFCTLVSNWKDLPPFISMSSSTATDSSRSRWNQSYEHGLELQRSGKDPEARDLFQQAIALDSMRADAHYHLAQCLLKTQQFEGSKNEFLRAKDLDVLRFRATSEFNEIIRRVSALPGARLIDAEKAFMDNSPNEILGDELITEHLHPNERGYFLMGKAFFQALRNGDQLVKHDQWATLPEPSDEELQKNAGVTDLDLETANIRVQILKSAWPFNENQFDNFVFKPTSTLQSVAFSYCEKEIGWDDAHYRMANYYVKKGEYDSAAREYRTVARELYLFYHPVMLLGDMQVLLHRYDQAESTYLRALELSDNQFVHMRLGTLYLQKGEADRALLQLRESLRLDDESTKKFTEDVHIIVLRELALAYEKKGAIDSAVVTMHRLLSLSPDNQTALEYLHKLEGK